MSRQAFRQSRKDSFDVAFWLLVGLLVFMYLYSAVSPNLGRRSHPPPALFITTGVILGSWFAARYSRLLPVFFIYGCFAGVLMVASHQPSWRVLQEMDVGITPLIAYGMYWFGIILLLGIGSRLIAHVRHLRIDRSKPPNKCVKCGYLLYGLTEPRCPECGKPFAPPDDSSSLSSNGDEI